MFISNQHLRRGESRSRMGRREWRNGDTGPVRTQLARGELRRALSFQGSHAGPKQPDLYACLSQALDADCPQEHSLGWRGRSLQTRPPLEELRAGPFW